MLRGAVNWVAGIGILIFLVFTLQRFVDPLIADLIGITIAFSVFFFLLHNRTIWILCPRCGYYIDSNTPWECGFNGCRNEQVDDFPFIYECQHCHLKPKAYQCHHCWELIFLTRDCLTVQYAKRLNTPARPPMLPSVVKPIAKEDTTAEKIARQQEEKRDLQHELEVTMLRGNIVEAKTRVKPPKKESVRERLRSKCASKRELDDEVRRLKAEADEAFKDPLEREKQYRLIESEARELLF